MDILQKILADTREQLIRRKQTTPPAFLESLPSFSAPTLSLAESLRSGPISVIAEIKKASPSKGEICRNFNVEDVTRAYTTGGADAISVLTEPLHFQGSLEYLAKARQVTDVPLLRKDFIFDPYQIVEARAYGADAVLLIATMLDPVQLHDLHQAAADMDLECLVEVYHADELETLDLDAIKLLGVNNRDLRTFEVDISHSVRLFKQVPESIVRVSESGLSTGDNLAFLELNGINAALMGQTFMRNIEPGRILRQTLADSRRLTEASSQLAFEV